MQADQRHSVAQEGVISVFYEHCIHMRN